MKPLLQTLLPLAVAVAATLAATAPRAHGDEPAAGFQLHKALAEARQATAAFNDVNAAIAANYTKFPDLQGDCVAQPGQGGMGIHYLNGALVDGELDPLRPELLVYRQAANGRLELAALEYVTPAPVWDASHAQPPSLFGHPFHLLRVPNRYGLTTPLYTLHVWLWEHNPDGLFNDWNPHVHCR
ncbi:MAG: hypothetical protein KF788_08975 [Piscinibacter sp.]|nr:hypothetical protein [Piscinibacter sp.]